MSVLTILLNRPSTRPTATLITQLQLKQTRSRARPDIRYVLYSVDLILRTNLIGDNTIYNYVLLHYDIDI